MRPELSQKLAAAVDRMPAFPKSVQKILELTRDVNCSPKDLVQVIDKDPVVTVKVLRVVNSAYYSLPKQITSINHAVVYLGFNTIKNLALSIAAIGMLPADNEAGFDGQQYLLHSLATAGIAKQLASRVGVDPMDCFIAGLLHDFGKVVFAQFMAAEFRAALEHSQLNQVPLHVAESAVIGADHTVVGAMLARRWQFAPELIDCIRDHHQPDGQSVMGQCLCMADQICRYQSYGNSGNPYWPGEAVVASARFGEDIDAVIARLGDMSRFVAEAQSFAQVNQE